MIQKRLKQLRDHYVITQVQKAAIPQMEESPICRYRICFYGRVQKVGFRLELAEMAKRLGLSGFCRNLPDSTVYAELQGPQNKIQFLISFMESLVRIKITKKTQDMIPLLDEKGFAIQ